MLPRAFRSQDCNARCAYAARSVFLMARWKHARLYRCQLDADRNSRVTFTCMSVARRKMSRCRRMLAAALNRPGNDGRSCGLQSREPDPFRRSTAKISCPSRYTKKTFQGQGRAGEEQQRQRGVWVLRRPAFRKIRRGCGE